MEHATTGTVRKPLVSLLAALALLVAMALPASAQQQDGLVNVMVGDLTILNDVNIGVAAQIAATICGVKVGPVAVLGRAVDRSGQTETVCTAEGGDVTIRQN